MIELYEIEFARARIRDFTLPTPIVRSASLSEICNVPVYLKLEHHQTTGSFKLRGAFNAVLQLPEAERSRGVITVSTGNHGRALSFAANTCGVKATICMSALVPENKVSEIRRLGAEVRVIGKSQDEAQEDAEQLASNNGLCWLPPFDHPAIVAGQGTIGLEIVEAVPDVATVLVGLSGGGLASGVALAIKSRRPEARVIGLSMDRGAAMKASLDAGRPVQVEEFESLADSLGGGIGLDNKLTFAMCQKHLDDVILLSEAEIAAGIRHAYAQEREILEGAGAIGIAALLASKISNLRGPVVTILSGRNIDMNLHRRVVSGQTGNW
ncbi:hydroxyectoine utilization dehydratase EutB [Rhizobium leguminosarum bv. trifolii]|uniref:hydroxyectoine utilization dehydratase EutB n=1 Tax=Rhizobium leguminosarum TaxID=384 RepID=UPI000E2E60B7|nr:hydroxyectoine utilization dehydratase EutB [Rhizobium leguminosarum]RFB86070.1 hydroxyectoine utilization dehydratase EutB [Rhizobium leguminosarum bv. trifolii]